MPSNPPHEWNVILIPSIFFDVNVHFYLFQSISCWFKHQVGKYIAFLSQLLLLFQFCHFCKADNPEVEVTESGTNVTVKTRCPNEQCNKESILHSQPFLPGSSIDVGNFLLPLAVVLAGGSATKMVNTFTHMGIRCISLKTFFKHQRVSVIHVCILQWIKKFVWESKHRVCIRLQTCWI